MKLIETYSNNCSVEIPDNPVNLPTQYFPVPAEKYITLQNSSGMFSKDYDLWQNVVDLIHPYLQKNNIEIIQIGKGEIRGLNKVINLTNQTTFAQSVYILKNALLHVGNDSWATHAAVTTPVVELFGPTSVSAHSPYYFNENSRFLESSRNGKNPSFQAAENPKSINLIKPELVAKNILEVLGIENEINQETFYLGDLYFQQCLEIIPDQIINPQSIPAGNVNLRADLFFNENAVIENLKLRPYILHLDQPISLDALKALKPNIPLLVYEINENTDVKYLESIIKLGINLQLNTILDENSHKLLKLKYLDLPLIFRRDDVKIENIIEKIRLYNNCSEDEAKEFYLKIFLDEKKFQYFSSKCVLSAGRLYLSIYDWRNNNPAESMESFSIGNLNDQEFINESAHFLLFT